MESPNNQEATKPNESYGKGKIGHYFEYHKDCLLPIFKDLDVAEEAFKFLPSLRQVEFARPCTISFLTETTTETCKPKPKKELVASPVSSAANVPWSKRTVTLASPRQNWKEIRNEELQRCDDIYKVPRSALTAVASSRIIELAKPRRINVPRLKHRLVRKLKMSRLKPVKPVTQQPPSEAINAEFKRRMSYILLPDIPFEGVKQEEHKQRPSLADIINQDDLIPPAPINSDFKRRRSYVLLPDFPFEGIEKKEEEEQRKSNSLLTDETDYQELAPPAPSDSTFSRRKSYALLPGFPFGATDKIESEEIRTGSTELQPDLTKEEGAGREIIPDGSTEFESIESFAKRMSTDIKERAEDMPNIREESEEMVEEPEGRLPDIRTVSQEMSESHCRVSSSKSLPLPTDVTDYQEWAPPALSDSTSSRRKSYAVLPGFPCGAMDKIINEDYRTVSVELQPGFVQEEDADREIIPDDSTEFGTMESFAERVSADIKGAADMPNTRKVSEEVVEESEGRLSNTSKVSEEISESHGRMSREMDKISEGRMPDIRRVSEEVSKDGMCDIRSDSGEDKRELEDQTFDIKRKSGIVEGKLSVEVDKESEDRISDARRESERFKRELVDKMSNIRMESGETHKNSDGMISGEIEEELEEKASGIKREFGGAKREMEDRAFDISSSFEAHKRESEGDTSYIRGENDEVQRESKPMASGIRKNSENSREYEKRKSDIKSELHYAEETSEDILPGFKEDQSNTKSQSEESRKETEGKISYIESEYEYAKRDAKTGESEESRMEDEGRKSVVESESDDARKEVKHRDFANAVDDSDHNEPCVEIKSDERKQEIQQRVSHIEIKPSKEGRTRESTQLGMHVNASDVESESDDVKEVSEYRLSDSESKPSRDIHHIEIKTENKSDEYASDRV